MIDPARSVILVVPEDLWAAMLEELSNLRAKQDWEHFIGHAHHLHFADPDRFHTGLITDEDWIQVLRAIQKEKTAGNWDNVAKLCAYLVGVDPYRAQQQPLIASTEWNNFFVGLEAARQQGYWSAFAAQASRIKVLLTSEAARQPVAVPMAA